MTSGIDTGDLRAAVAAGILSESQAADLRSLSENRQGLRAAMPQEDEPFEFFRGFSEIFVSVGIVILLAGVAATLAFFGNKAVSVALPLIMAGIAWWWATYFTLKRRMNLPSMVLASAFGGGVGFAVLSALVYLGIEGRVDAVLPPLVAAGALALWYRRFRLPFTMFLLGGAVLLTLYALTASEDAASLMWKTGVGGIFDLRASPRLALATLIFGLAALVAAMWFDTRDPNRLGRHAASAFWLHLLAAPALVNTVALTLYNIGGGLGVALTAVAIALIGIFALIIDRRSFLTAGIAYLGLVIAWAIRGGPVADFGKWAIVLLILGGLVTSIGTWWVLLRSWLMRITPEFPGKSALPPYASAE